MKKFVILAAFAFAFVAGTAVLMTVHPPAHFEAQSVQLAGADIGMAWF
jgi:hypothetical protein